MGKGFAELILTDGGLVNLGKLINYVAISSVAIVVAGMTLLGSAYQNGENIKANTAAIEATRTAAQADKEQLQELRLLVTGLATQAQTYQEAARERVERLERQVDGLL
tara:strand:+ start:1450 stop:1773 length:324 start_codon:yes stop_codon:yes gene_type:complete